ncbi:MAG: hypothetical protein OWR52_06150 [Acidibacillus sp.]|nr:hypothetical protein [Acidibacillus sp.]
MYNWTVFSDDFLAKTPNNDLKKAQQPVLNASGFVFVAVFKYTEYVSVIMDINRKEIENNIEGEENMERNKLVREIKKSYIFSVTFFFSLFLLSALGYLFLTSIRLMLIPVMEITFTFCVVFLIDFLLRGKFHG